MGTATHESVEAVVLCYALVEMAELLRSDTGALPYDDTPFAGVGFFTLVHPTEAL